MMIVGDVFEELSSLGSLQIRDVGIHIRTKLSSNFLTDSSSIIINDNQDERVTHGIVPRENHSANLNMMLTNTCRQFLGEIQDFCSTPNMSLDHFTKEKKRKKKINKILYQK